MKLYKRKIREYTNHMQQNKVRDEAVVETISLANEAFVQHENFQISYMEFLYQQLKFIKKKWWIWQSCVLVVLWFVLSRSDSPLYTQRFMSVGALLFVIFIIPEVWKNRRASAMEIESASFYTLRQIYSARIFLFGIIDLVLISIFFLLTFYTKIVTLEMFVINFVIPFNVSCGICFYFLSSKKNESEYMAVTLCIAWIIIWMSILSREAIYSIITIPIWCGGLFLSFIFLIYYVKRAHGHCERSWEGNQLWY